MKQITLNLIKKNRIWIECKTKDGYTCKLKNDDKTKNLELGLNDLVLNDISIHSKYGTDLRYEVVSTNDEKIFLQAEYNKILIEKCKNLGGIYDYDTNAWVFPKFLQDEVDVLEQEFCSEKIDVEILASDDIYKCNDAIYFCGHLIAKATSRDSGASLGKNIYQIQGKIHSAGSIKNWGTFIEKDSIFRLSVSKNLLEKYAGDEFVYKILD